MKAPNVHFNFNIGIQVSDNLSISKTNDITFNPTINCAIKKKEKN